MFQYKIKVKKPYGYSRIIFRGTKFETLEGGYVFKDGEVKFESTSSYISYKFVYNGNVYYATENPEVLTEFQLIRRAGKFGRKIVAEKK
jgi:hypothetical protein